MTRPFLLAGLLAFLVSTAAMAEGDKARGETVFKRCATCHSLKAGENKVGPDLAHLFGRKAGSVEGAHYSAAMKNSGLVWDAATLDAYLAAPAKKVPGTTMAVGVPNETDRADLIAYLSDR